jgi:hypothetical protein
LPPPAPAPERAGCFAKGCLFGCAVPFVLTVLLIVVGSRLFNPLVQHLRGKNQYAEYIARGLDALNVLSSDDSSDTEVAVDASGDSSVSRRSARRPGTSDPAGVPRDLPRNPKSLETLYNVGPDHILIFQRINGPREAAIAQMRAGMQQQGWALVSENPGDWSTIIRWKKADRISAVEFAEARSGGTEIWMKSSRQSPSPGRQ